MQLYKIFIFIVFALLQTMFYPLSAQVAPPVIENIDKTSGTVNEVVTISGSGFGSDPAKVSVFFGAAQASAIISITDTRIRVAVPAGTTSSSISVTNLSNNLTAYSSKLFTLSYDGNDFELNKLDGEYTFPTSGTNLYNLCSCDFNLDGLNDIATTDTESRTITVLQNASPDINSVNFIQKQFTIAARTRWVRCGDLNGDGLPDLVFSASNTNTSTEKIYIFKNISTPGGDVTFEIPSTPLSYSVDGNLAARMEIKDMDSDGLPEIIAADLSSVGGVSVFRNQSTPGGAINFAATPVTPFSTFNIPAVELGSVDVEDLNGDGLPELLVAKEDQNNVYVFTNTSTPGNINFSSYIILKSSTQASNMNMKVSDINGDHKPDVTIINNYYVGIYKNTTQIGEPITFDEQIRFDQIELTRESLDIADMDGNRKPDIIVGSTINRIVVLLNNSTEENIDFSAKKTLFINEKNNSVRAGDLNGDGKPDLAYTGRTTNVVSVLLNRNCIKPVLEPQGGLTVCDTLPYQLTVTKAIGANYTWESSEDGVSPFTPVADAVDSTFSFTTSVEAFYRVTVSSSHNGFSCSEISNVVEVSRPDGFVPKKPVIINPNPETPYCFGETVIIKTEYINADFVWIDPDHNIIPDATTNMLVLENVTAADAGEYQVFAKAKPEQGGCQSEIAATTILVSEPKAISIQRNKLPVFFQGGQVTLSVEDVAGSTYSWKRNGQVISNINSPKLTATAAGDYVAVIKNSQGCTRESAPLTVALAQANIPEKTCINEPVEFTVTPVSLVGQDIRYRWYFGNGNALQEGDTVSHTFKTAGTFPVAVEVLSADGSIADRFEKLLTVLDLPDLKIATTNNSVYLCPGESIKLTATEGFSSYNWNTGATSGTITVREAGIYKLTATSSSGCAVSQSVEVKHAEVPEITITARTDHIYLGDTIRLTAAPSDTAATYLWSPRSTLDDNTSANPVARPLSTTTYTCTVISKDGCQTTAEFTITVTRALDVTAQKVFTPNNDGSNDTWHIDRMDLYPDCRMTVFNRQGIKVYEAENYSNQNGWDGTIRGIPAPAGVYFYLINCGEEAGSQAGSVTLVR